MTDLAAFLTARLAEDAADAVAALNHVGLLTRADLPRWIQAVTEDEGECVSTLRPMGNAIRVADCPSDVFTAHIARWDPARVLAEITAKRRVLARHQRMGSVYRDALVPDACEGCGLDEGEWNVADINECPELLDLAAPFSGHEDFDESWRT